MIYIETIKPSANTSEINALIKTLKVWKGVIHSIDIFIPSGHSGLAKLQIFHGGHIIMPTNEDEFISGDDTFIRGKFFIELKKQTNDLFIKAWNDDDTEAHEFIIHIGVLPKFALIPVGSTEGITKSLRSLFLDKIVVVPREEKQEGDANGDGE